MHAREALHGRRRLGPRFSDLHPIVQPGMSGLHASFDNVLQALTLGGRSPLHAMMMMAPMAWEKNPSLSPEARAFYRYHAYLMEPWDGPSALVFSDGRYVAATLDRNGLRPARFKLYDDGYFVLGSEAGVAADMPGRVLQAGRLAPGRMIAVDLREGKLLLDEDIKAAITEDPGYLRWSEQHLANLRSFADTHPAVPPAPAVPTLVQQLAFGYDADELDLVLTPLAEGREPDGSMGDDTPLAVLSRRPRLLYQYFKQLFAQVTNPPIDPIREKSVVSVASGIGGRLNLFEKEPQMDGLVDLDTPVLLDHEVAALPSLEFLHGRVARFEGPIRRRRSRRPRAGAEETGAGGSKRRRDLGRARHHFLRPRRRPRQGGHADAAGHGRRPAPADPRGPAPEMRSHS